MITTFESGSTGNLHLLEFDDKKILLECGLSMRKITEYLDHNLNINACLLSHYHGDHSKSAAKIMELGINLYCSQETADYLELKSHRLKIIKTLFTIKGINIYPFRTNHDTPGSLGFIIHHGSDRILFATDTGSMPYKFPGMTHIIIECNYMESIIDELEPKENTRIKKTHMGLNDVLSFLENNDLSLVKEIRLIHLSNRNSDPDYFKSEVQKLTGKLIIIS